MVADPHRTALHDALAKHFGFRAFLEGQERVVAAITTGSDTVVVMPTGGGKSLCYQLPAMMLEGLTVVVSPLIALMKDQVDAMVAKSIPATFINSSLGEAEIEQRIRRMARGEFRLVYIAPERFKSSKFVQALAPLSIALFAVDEAHCISQWGHDFRPDYIRLKAVLADLGRPQVAALTATATPEVRADIVTQLGLGVDGRDAPLVLVSGFARQNLTFVVSRVKKAAEKIERIVSSAKALRTGIVYCATRKNVENVAQALADRGVSCVAYHAGLTDEQRSAAQDAFMSRKVPVAVATNAFGMGVDRADVRFVIHYDIPGSVEAYYQEAGRAGRDGEPAWCELLYTYADVRTQEFFIEGSNPTRQVISGVYDTVRFLCANGEVEMPVAQIATMTSSTRNPMAVGGALHQLERAGVIERAYAPGSRTYTTRLIQPVKPFDELDIDYAYLDKKRTSDEAKLQQIISYAEHTGCRHKYILAYFGDADAPARCATCDCCIAHARAVRLPDDEECVVIRKVLSGVARLDGRFGRGRIVQMLVGSHAKEVLDADLDQLSTYALLEDEGSEYVWALLEALIAAECVAVSTGDYPVLSLTAIGREVMQGRKKVPVALPERGLPAAPRGKKGRAARADLVPHETGPADQTLLDSLRSWRREKAEELGVPAFHIYSNKVLEAIALTKPGTNLELLALRGIGPAKARQFGAETLALVAAHHTGKKHGTRTIFPPKMPQDS